MNCLASAYLEKQPFLTLLIRSSDTALTQVTAQARLRLCPGLSFVLSTCAFAPG